MRRLGRVPLLAVVVAAALAHFLVPAAAPAIAVGADLFRLHHCFSFFFFGPLAYPIHYSY